jgi:outer membrane protein OmpA-like peptidoglycan-associated protein
MQWNFSDIAPSLDNGDLIFVETEALLNNGETIRSRSTALETRLLEKKYEQYRKQGNASVFKFALLLFEFDTLTTRQHIDIIAKEIKQRISPLSEITIIGHTDRTGTQEYNYRLAEERADAAVRLLNLQGRATVVAAGQSTPLFTNELPEGRFYNRTAEIIIKTPEAQR